MKRKSSLIILLLIILVIIIPQPSADIYIRLHFSEIAGDKLQLFYSTDTSDFFSQEQSITSVVDKEKKQVTFRLDGELYKHITGLRLDFPLQDVLKVSSITVSSGGVVKKQYDPIHFFAPASITVTNDVELILIESRRITAVSTGEVDPFVDLSGPLTADICHSFSHFWITKIVICLFILLCYVLSQKRIFDVETRI